MPIERFGRSGDTDVLEVTLATAAGTQARIITWGAVLRDLVVPGPRGRQRVVLGLNTIEDYLACSPYFGAIVGRYANRIGQARFRLDGETYRLTANENGNQLHGGPAGFGRRLWTVVDHDDASVTLALVSEDGDMGYPGRLVALCAYTLQEPATVRIALEATCDRPTPVNLTTHAYYNLDGAPTILDHSLAIASEQVTPTDQALIPTGALTPVAGTPYDFRAPRPIGPPEANDGILFDINFVLRRQGSLRSRAHPLDASEADLAHAATLASPASGIALDLWTTEPGVQFYNGHKLAVPVPGLDGTRYGRFAGLALEPQRFPDGPNRAWFPPCILAPGLVSRQISELRFSARG
jgi:aldose 1-epimerase